MLQMIKLPWLWRTPALTAETGSPLSPQPEESDHWGQLKVSCYTESDFIHLLLFSQLGDHRQAAFDVGNLRDNDKH